MRKLAAVGAVLALVGLVWSAARVWQREAAELEERAGPFRIRSLHRTDPNRTEQTVRPLEVELEEGERYFVELCAEVAAPQIESFADSLHVVFWIPAAEKLVSRTPLDVERLRTGRARGDVTCWTVGLGDVEEGGRYAVELFWPETPPRPAVAATPLTARVMAYRRPDGADRSALGILTLGMLLLLAGLAAPPPTTTPAPGSKGLGTVAVGLLLLGGLVVASGLLSGGPTRILFGGLLVAMGEVLLVIVLVARDGASLRERLALHRSARIGLWAVPVVAVLIVAGSLLVQRLFPPPGVAPVELVVAWPSGKLAFAALGLVVPVAEEVFFRGFVYGTLRDRLGGAVAFGGTAVLFVLAHVPQQWGNWGGLGAVAIVGVLLTGLRHWGHALWPCVLAHLLYNATLVVFSWL